MHPYKRIIYCLVFIKYERFIEGNEGLCNLGKVDFKNAPQHQKLRNIKVGQKKHRSIEK